MHEALSTLNTVQFQLPPIRMAGLLKVTGSHIRYVCTDIADIRQVLIEINNTISDSLFELTALLQ